MKNENTTLAMSDLYQRMTERAKSLGFAQIGISDLDLEQTEQRLAQWVAQHFHGEMGYMVKHGKKRTRPADLVPGTVRVITVMMNYWPEQAAPAWPVLNNSHQGYISRYALGRDYHKVMRKRLKTLANYIKALAGDMAYRVFCDSAPVMEKALAQKSGLGWQGKHSNIINREHGSYFFLGEIYTDLPLKVTAPVSDHCGSCSACITDCPTQAIIAPYIVDARRCISYLTIELKGTIPLALRKMMGNRIYGCDDCQLVCPWNKFTQATQQQDYLPREGLDAPQLVTLFLWSEAHFLTQLQGSPIRRIGYESWLRNIAIALGNAAPSPEVLAALRQRQYDMNPIVREHVQWALQEQTKQAS